MDRDRMIYFKRDCYRIFLSRDTKLKKKDETTNNAVGMWLDRESKEVN